MPENIYYDDSVENLIPDEVKTVLSDMYQPSVFRSFGWVAEVYFNKYLNQWRVAISPESQISLPVDCSLLHVHVSRKGQLPAVIWMDSSHHVLKRLNQFHAYRTTYTQLKNMMMKHLNDNVAHLGNR